MKFIVISVFVGLTLFIASCGTTRGAHCDAYGSIDSTHVDDLARK